MVPFGVLLLGAEGKGGSARDGEKGRMADVRMAPD